MLACGMFQAWLVVCSFPKGTVLPYFLNDVGSLSFINARGLTLRGHQVLIGQKQVVAGWLVRLATQGMLGCLTKGEVGGSLKLVGSCSTDD